MKLEKLLNKANKEINSDKEVRALDLIKCSIKRINQAKKVLKDLEKQHSDLLKKDLKDIEEFDFEY